MTFQPPPPPPPPPPPGGTPPPPPPPGGGQPYGSQPGQPGQQWGAPPPSSGSGFDPKSIDPLDWSILGIGLLTFIFSFMSFYSLKPKGDCSFGCVTVHNSAWSGFFGWFAVLLVLIGAGLVAMALFAPQVKLPVAPRLICLGAFAVATLCMILALFIVPKSYKGVSIPGNLVNTGHSYAYWIDFILIIGGLVLSLMRAQQTGTAMPGPLNKMPKIGS